MSDLGLCIVCNKPLRGEQVKCCSIACVRAMQTLPPEPCSQCGKSVPRRGRLTCSTVCARLASGAHNPSHEAWSPELREIVRALWAEGVSTVAIGEWIGFSKNAVCGMVRRLGLPKRREAPNGFTPSRHSISKPNCKLCDQPAYCRGLCSRHYWQQHKPAPRENSRPLFDRIQRPSHEPEVRMLFDTLTPRQSASLGRKPPRPPEPKPQPKPEPFSVFRTCQFIEAEDRKAYRFCDQPTQPGSAYCPSHHRRCYVPRHAALEEAA